MLPRIGPHAKARFSVLMGSRGGLHPSQRRFILSVGADPPAGGQGQENWLRLAPLVTAPRGAGRLAGLVSLRDGRYAARWL
jgi:hypothetical protein